MESKKRLFDNPFNLRHCKKIRNEKVKMRRVTYKYNCFPPSEQWNSFWGKIRATYEMQRKSGIPHHQHSQKYRKGRGYFLWKNGGHAWTLICNCSIGWELVILILLQNAFWNIRGPNNNNTLQENILQRPFFLSNASILPWSDIPGHVLLIVLAITWSSLSI